MTENIKRVTNPLTIIAIFAALAEINSTVAIGLVKDDLQPIFLWFVILFPVLLVLLFFGTLIFKSSVIYAPSDFKDEVNFLKTRTVRQFAMPEVPLVIDRAKDNIRQVEEVVHQRIQTAEQTSTSTSRAFPDTPKLRASVAQLYSTIISNLKRYYKENTIPVFTLQIINPSYCIFYYELNKEKLLPNSSSSQQFLLLRVSLVSGSGITYELINTGYCSNDVVELTKHISAQIALVVSQNINLNPE